MAGTTTGGRRAPRSLAEVKAARKPPKHVYKEVEEKLSRLDKLALWITDHVGTMTFFLVIFVGTAFWLSWNLLAPRSLQFDQPMGFVFWLFMSNLIQIMLMPLLMVGQNIQGKHSEARSLNDLEINVRAEQEVETILEHLEYQNEMLLALVKKLDVNVSGMAAAAKPIPAKPAAKSKPAPRKR